MNVYTHWRRHTGLGYLPTHHLKDAVDAERTLCGVQAHPWANPAVLVTNLLPRVAPALRAHPDADWACKSCLRVVRTRTLNRHPELKARLREGK